MTLWDGTRASGKLLFCLEFQERSNTTFTLRDVTLTPGAGAPSSTGKLSLEVSFRSPQDKEVKTTTANSGPCQWRETQGVKARVTVRDLIDQFLNLRVLSDRTEVFSGDYIIDVEALLGAQGGIPITVASSTGNGSTLSATLFAADMPTYAQMKEGVHADDDFKECQPLYPCLPTPQGYKKPATTVAAASRFAAAARAGVAQQNFVGNFAQGGNPGGDPGMMAMGGVQENGLPPGWDEYTDPATGHKFYINRATGVSQWEKPVVETQRLSGDVPRAAAAGSAAAGSGMYPQLTDNNNNINNNVNNNGGGNQGLPPGFREERDPQGRIYYFNVATGASQWERPGAAAPAPMPGPMPGGYPGAYSGAYPPVYY